MAGALGRIVGMVSGKDTMPECAQSQAIADMLPLFPRGLAHKQRWIMQVVAGFFDESTDDETHGQCYSIAGFVGSQWATAVLEMHWKPLLEKYDIDYFKASELNAGEGQFKKFRDNPDAKAWAPFSDREKEFFRVIKTEFTNVITNARDIFGIGVALVLPDYYRLREESPLAKKNLLTPYHLCAQTVLMEAGMIMYETNNELAPSNRALLKPVFDSHEQYSGRMKMAFDTFCEKNPNSSTYLLPPDYEDEKFYLTLQAADNLAYESRRYLLHQHFGSPAAPRRSMTEMLEQGSVVRLYKLDYRSLKIIAESQTADRLPIDPVQDAKLSEMESPD